ncbi:hypothetical protein TWF106_007092 [Orbilia oligospora]|uniref:F-box domain-containing protein n=1 Tax=Orbilia oligospora TaxID=2813651 RepID=A0A6G1M5I4_ORBOL|nr:hypothetical protein TWF788_009913 [Orbilia oligospora]KAF3207898.1 hypothetical protein TWF679_008227 [Orbilia oligospora]KAF3219251.1 hypothetical protein TWF106_007092 [Orbilia oligospora]KAF3220490.1 hypothetical protein TWF191_007389 [Orbilia oligospora]KAF3244754.1 hypothetical protein TWF192_007686 [Orbilia oligospora]
MESSSTEASKPAILSFLDLPQEIRIQIYTYVLPDPIYRGYNCKRGAYPLSIFRVNRQIHDESTQLFYSRSIFDIEILVDGRLGVDDPECESVYEVVYQSPWEVIGYGLTINKPTVDDGKPIRWVWYGIRKAYEDCTEDSDKKFMSARQYAHLQQPGVILFPSPRYRPFLRRIEIEITESCDRDMDLSRKHYGEEATTQLRTLLSPLLWRLREVLPNTASVDITFIPWWDPLKSTLEKELKSKGTCGTLSHRTDTEGLERYSNYVGSLEAAYLFTRGPWNSSFSPPPYLNSIFPGLKEEVFAKCDLDATLQEAIAQKALERVNIEMDNDLTFWATRNGTLLLCQFEDPASVRDTRYNEFYAQRT